MEDVHGVKVGRYRKSLLTRCKGSHGVVCICYCLCGDIQPYL